MKLPHPIPYQGSKRNLAPKILNLIQGKRFATIYEPFAGSAAFTIAAASQKIANKFVISDSLAPLMEIWQQVVDNPKSLADLYEQIWKGQNHGGEDYFFEIREEFNSSSNPAKLLYLLARCVKNAPRFNSAGKFNQSHDKRRLGMRPEKMRHEIFGVNKIFSGKVAIATGDFESISLAATRDDLVYMDPPWEGTSGAKDRRYFEGLSRERLIEVITKLNDKGVPLLLSYDGMCGEKTYGEMLPASLGLKHVYLDAGRSSQATLVGRDETTLESLYYSNSLAEAEPAVSLSTLWGDTGTIL